MKDQKTAIQKFNDLREQHKKARAAASTANQELLEIQRQPTEGLELDAVEQHFERMKSAMQRSRDAALEFDRITQELEKAQVEAHAETLAKFRQRQPELEDEKNAAFLRFRAAVDALVDVEQAYTEAFEAATGNIAEYRNYCESHGLPVDDSLRVGVPFDHETGIHKRLEPLLRGITWRQQQVNFSRVTRHMDEGELQQLEA